ncbi:MAG: hypothetical protein NTV66_08305 [Methylococcales bacterium]|jgi:hypothetical protein|nr:hypothetical protein [Methylococcales bacterium]
MKISRNYLCWLAALSLLLGVLGLFESALAAPRASDSSAAIKKAQGIIRQLTLEKSALVAEKTTWEAEKIAKDSTLSSLEALVKKLQPLEGEVARYKSGLESVKTSLESQLGQQRQREQALQQKHTDVVTKANAIFADNQLLVQAVQEREQWITECGARNKKLQTFYFEILNKYKEKGVWEQLAELDPLTGIGKVATENVVQDYKYKLQQLKITPFKAAETNQSEAVDGEQDFASAGSEAAKQ